MPKRNAPHMYAIGNGYKIMFLRCCCSLRIPKLHRVGSALHTAKHIFMINSELIDCVYVLTLNGLCVLWSGPTNANRCSFHTTSQRTNGKQFRRLPTVQILLKQ